MTLARSLLIGAAFALAVGCTDDTPKSGPAADKNDNGKVSSAPADNRAQSAAKPTRTAVKKPQPKNAGFNGLDKNGDGFLTRVEARGNPQLASNFKAADRNKDGKLNRAEYRAGLAKKDADTAKTKVAVHRKASVRPSSESGVQPP